MYRRNGIWHLHDSRFTDAAEMTVSWHLDHRAFRWRVRAFLESSGAGHLETKWSNWVYPTTPRPPEDAPEQHQFFRDLADEHRAELSELLAAGATAWTTALASQVAQLEAEAPLDQDHPQMAWLLDLPLKLGAAEWWLHDHRELQEAEVVRARRPELEIRVGRLLRRDP